MTALVTLAAVLAYAAGIMLAARWRYRAIRPYTEPLSCASPSLHSNGGHWKTCYRRYDIIDSTAEAVISALQTGLIWPFIAPALGVRRLVTSGARTLPEELRAQIERLEAENEQLRRQQETSDR